MKRPHINGVRGWGTLFIGLSSAVIGLAYFPFTTPDRIPGALNRLSEWVPLTAYAVAWVIAGATAMTQAFRSPDALTGREHDFAAVAAVCAMWSVWGYSYLFEWVIAAWHGHPDDRSYVLAAAFLGPAFLIFCWGMLGRGVKAA